MLFRRKILFYALTIFTFSLNVRAQESPLGGVGLELGATLGQVAGGLTSINQFQATQQAQQQLLQRLNSQEAQTIQMNINMASQELSNIFSRELMPCLQRNSIAAPYVNAAIENRNRPVLGTNSCRNPGIDESVLKDDLTCGNAERALDASEKEKRFQECRRSQMQLLARVVSCFDGFDAKLNQASQRLKTFLSQRQSFMQKAFEAFNNSIQGHEQAIAKITADVEGPEGYKAHVARLDNLLNTLEDALTSPAESAARTTGANIEFEGNKLEAGLVERARHMASTEGVELANRMFEQVVGTTERCFTNGATLCDASTGSLPANACLARLACNGIPAGPGFQSRCNQNREVLRKITTDIGTEAQFNQRTSGGNLNPLDPNQILAASDSERDRLEALIMRSFDRYVNAGIQQGFTVGGSVDFLRTKIKTQLERCHNMSRRQFAELYNTNRSSRNPVRAALEEYRKKQLELEGDLDRWIRVVADRMTKFRAKFTSTFDSTLKQFHQDCRSTSAGSSVAGADATAGSGRSQQMLACLETLKQRLEGGLNGTNGEGATIIQIPVINGTPGAQGSSNQIVSQQCQGFKDCIVKLDLAKKIHGEQKDALVSQRQAQASQHNQIVEGILDQVGAAFNTAMNSPNGLKGMLARVNNLLTQNGIASQLNPKERDKEELVKDDKINPDDPKSQIYKNPTNILSVLAQRGGLQEIKQEDVNDIKKAIEDKLNGSGSGDSNNGIISRIATANRTMGRARTKLAQCTPGESDYRAINDYLGGCNDIQRICRRGIMGTLGQLERIGSIVANDSNDGRDSGLNRREQNMDTYQRCLREMRENDRLTSGDSSLERILASRDGGSRPFSQQTRDPLTQLETEFACYEQARGGINQLFGRARPDYRGRHNSMMSSMDQLIGACEGYRTDHLNSMEPVDEANRAVASSENNEITRCRAETGPNGSLNTRLSDLERDHDQVVNAVMAQARAQTAVPYGPEPEIGQQGRILRQNFTRILGSYFGRTKSAISEGVRGGIVVAAGTGFLRDFFLNPDTYFNDMRTSLAPSLTAQDRAVLAPANLPAFRVFVEEVLKPAWSDNQTNPGLAAIVNGYTDKANRLADDFANCMRTARSNAAGRTAHRREVASGVVSTHDDAIRTACQAVTSEANALGERAGSDRRNRSDGNETPIFDQPAR